MKIIILVVILMLVTQGVYSMTNNEKELLEALGLASKYLEGSQDVHVRNAIYTPPAQSLRNAADEMEQKDKDVLHIREVIEKYSEDEDTRRDNHPLIYKD